MTQQQLIQIFKNKNYAPKSLQFFLEQHKDKKQFFEKEYEKYKDRFSFYIFIKYYYFGLLQKRCLQCGKYLQSKQITAGYNFCSYQCCNKSQLKKTKVINTCIQRYGVPYAIQNADIFQKLKQTNLNKRGCCFPTQDSDVIEKSKKTCLQKYGYQIATKSQIIKDKVYKTNMQKYGYKMPLCNKEIRNKRTINQKKQFIVKFLNDVKQFVLPMFDVEKYDGCSNGQVFKWKCVKCGNQFESTIHTTAHLKQNRYIPRCLVCYPYVENCFKSNLENEVIDCVNNFKQYSVLQNVRSVIQPYELDVYVPQKNVAFEFDGVYWHNQWKKDKNYHLMKTQKCQQKNIQLIHIFEDQWVNKQDVVKDRIKNILGIYDNRIYARKCIIKEIKSSICKQFLDNNHIQGSDNSKIRLGLFYNDQLISVMTFSKPRFNKNYEYQLVRFSSKLGYQVVGGASKLLKYFEINYQPKSLISYADRRYSNGKLYYALGFSFLNNSEPNYWWCKGWNKFSRYQCQKHKLKELLGQDKFDQKLSQSQNMYNNHYYKIYDCGNMVFAKQY